MFTLFLIGLICLAICYPVHRFLEKRGSRWSNLVMALLIIVGIVCLGFFAGLD